MNDDDAFDFDRWADLIAQQEAEIEYTTPIRKRLRQRALEKEEDLLKQRALATERDFFWRDTSQHLTGRSRPTT